MVGRMGFFSAIMAFLMWYPRVFETTGGSLSLGEMQILNQPGLATASKANNLAGTGDSVGILAQNTPRLGPRPVFALTSISPVSTPSSAAA